MKNLKKIVALALAAVMVLVCFAGCAKKDDTTNSDVKIGVILVGDESEGYTEAHIEGIKEAAKACGISDSQIVWKYKIEENEKCYEAACDLVESGCTYIFSNSYSHQSYMVQAAKENPDVTFLPATGDTAAVCGLSNVKNYFTAVYESRYVSGVVAGMKLEQLIKDGKVSKDKALVGYVGAYPYAEVVSGYTAFFLGIRSVVSTATMQVLYTNSWFDKQAEANAAKTLISKGCVIIGQHADSEGAPSECEAELKEGKVCYSVGYNVDMLTAAPTAALTSATNVWSAYYTEAFKDILDGTTIPTDWSKGYNDGAVAITALGKSCADGTDAKVKEVEAAIKDGSLHVFDASTFTVDGKNLTTYTFDSSTMNSDFTAVQYQGKKYECIKDDNGTKYFSESEFRSAPYFDIRVDGITELNNK